MKKLFTLLLVTLFVTTALPSHAIKKIRRPKGGTAALEKAMEDAAIMKTPAEITAGTALHPPTTHGTPSDLNTQIDGMAKAIQAAMEGELSSMARSMGNAISAANELNQALYGLEKSSANYPMDDYPEYLI